MALQPVGDGAGDEVLSELREGRTRELLMLLQSKPIPEIVDPMDVQSGLSKSFDQLNGDFELGVLDIPSGELEDFEGDDVLSFGDSNWSDVPSYNEEDLSLVDRIDGQSIRITDDNAGVLESYRDTSFQPDEWSFQVEIGGDLTAETKLTYSESSNAALITVTHEYNGAVQFSDDNTDINTTIDTEVGTVYNVFLYFDWTTNSYDWEVFDNGTGDLLDSGNDFEMSSNANEYAIKGFASDIGGISGTQSAYWDNIGFGKRPALSGYVTDRYSAPTTEPTDFKAWNAIQARDVSEGGSTSTEPVEFEILDSNDDELTNSRIPKEQIADEPFTMRDRVHSEDADSDDQADYTISETGNGGHFGIPILTVVSVKKNGSLIESSNWEYDDDDTVTIDTSNVTISASDAVEIKYDLDVFDSTLQPRAYLNRETGDETSPSISHFRYEYVI